MTKTLICDMDGTLIECSRFYLETNAKGAAYLAEVTGLPHESILKAIDAIDLAAVTLPDGFAKERYPRSFEAAALALCHAVAPQRPSVVPYWPHATAMREIAEEVFEAPYPEYPGVREVLEQYKAAGWTLVLYTKGDRDVQSRKIEMHGFQTLFDRCVIVPKKSVEQLRQVAERLQIDITGDTWMVGDSLKDDIAPAQALGVKTVHVEVEAHLWAYDAGTVTPTAAVHSVAELPTVVPLVSVSGGAEAA